MPAAKCICSPDDHCRAMRPPAFKAPPCPCQKCKERVRERQSAQGRAMMQSSGGNPCANRQQGNQCGGASAGGAGAGGAGCSCSSAVAGAPASSRGICSTTNHSCANASGGAKLSSCGQCSCNKNYRGGPGGASKCGGGGGGVPGSGGMGGYANACTEDTSCTPPGSSQRFGPGIRNNPGPGPGYGPGPGFGPAGPGFGPAGMGGRGGKGGRMCTADNKCEGPCGPSTGCDPACTRAGCLRGPVGISFFKNEQLNFVCTVLLEILGILVFFAICTLTFWITVGYYIVHLLIELKNAQRNVQIAVLIVVGLLVIAFAITLVTNKAGPCCKGRPKAKAATAAAAAKAKCKTKCAAKGQKKAATAAAKKKSSCSKCAMKSSAAKAKAQKPCKKCPTGTTSGKPKAKVDGKAKSGQRPRCRGGAEMPRSWLWTRRSYNDWEGREIFQNSRRYAIPTEMKQPPTLVIWMRDFITRLVYRDS